MSQSQNKNYIKLENEKVAKPRCDLGEPLPPPRPQAAASRGSRLSPRPFTDPRDQDRGLRALTGPAVISRQMTHGWEETNDRTERVLGFMDEPLGPKPAPLST